MDSSRKTNGEAARELLRTQGIEMADGFVFELPSGLEVIVTANDDPFLDKPYEAGTRITVRTSAKASACILGWYLHQNDLDPWPSNFHAHNYDRNEVLDCDSGVIYDATTRKPVRKMRRKKLAAFLDEVPDRLKQSK